MNNPSDLLYSDTHEWVKIEGDSALIGITDFAQHQLGDITFVELPDEGAELAAGDEMGVVESVKAASDLYSPVSGTVTKVNASLGDRPEIINQSPYTEGWLIRVKLSSQPEGLVSAKEYEALAQE
jgi:glycine cleavage system H protein